jgi:hypothetical protein
MKLETVFEKQKGPQGRGPSEGEGLPRSRGEKAPSDILKGLFSAGSEGQERLADGEGKSDHGMPFLHGAYGTGNAILSGVLGMRAIHDRVTQEIKGAYSRGAVFLCDREVLSMEINDGFHFLKFLCLLHVLPFLPLWGLQGGLLPPCGIISAVP